jgi:phosphoglucomutase
MSADADRRTILNGLILVTFNHYMSVLISTERLAMLSEGWSFIMRPLSIMNRY